MWKPAAVVSKGMEIGELSAVTDRHTLVLRRYFFSRLVVKDAIIKLKIFGTASAKSELALEL